MIDFQTSFYTDFRSQDSALAESGLAVGKRKFKAKHKGRLENQYGREY